MARDPYQVLGVPRGAGADDIRKAFRKPAKKLHPDTIRGAKAAEARFNLARAAFHTRGEAE